MTFVFGHDIFLVVTLGFKIYFLFSMGLPSREARTESNEQTEREAAATCSEHCVISFTFPLSLLETFTKSSQQGNVCIQARVNGDISRLFYVHYLQNYQYCTVF